MDGRMRAAQTNEQQMEQTEPHVDAERPPKKPPGRAINSWFIRHPAGEASLSLCFLVRRGETNIPWGKVHVPQSINETSLYIYRSAPIRKVHVSMLHLSVLLSSMGSSAPEDSPKKSKKQHCHFNLCCRRLCTERYTLNSFLSTDGRAVRTGTDYEICTVKARVPSQCMRTHKRALARQLSRSPRPCKMRTARQDVDRSIPLRGERS
jgi:hypothetical protein